MNIVFIIVAASCLVLVAGHTTTTRPSPTKQCGYESCNPVTKGMINVHIVPHTHDDVGWLKTVDQYFYGSNTRNQNAGVQYILNTVVDSLYKNRNRKFIYVETAFFWKWWIKQHDIVKSKVRKLVNHGQLEFISGGWSMNDEATTHYQSIIDQMTWGLRKLNDTFGECGRPKVGWQIDPFGHSKEMANIFSQLGFDGVLLGRIDYQEKQYRWQTRTPEMVWRGSNSLGAASDIFTSVMYNTYGPPPGFCFDLLCNDDPIIDDKNSFEYNVDSRVDDFFSYLDNVTKVYTTSNVIITMGEDFNYQDAEAWFINLDKLIYYGNQRQANGSKYNLFYSTPSCYVKAVYDETKGQKVWLLKQDDFFPYASDPHAFWTGYFTSRPTLKRFERYGNNFLQACKQLYALAGLGPEDRTDLNALREAMGVMQHHDAITGTEKQHVAFDYARHLQRGIDECEIITNAAIRKLVNKTNSFVNIDTPNLLTFNTCPLLNISQCEQTETTNKKFLVTVYNPLSRHVSKIVRLPILGTAYNVKGPEGTNLTTQIIPIPDFVKKIPGRTSKADYELLFVANYIPAMGFKSYVVTDISDLHDHRGVPVKVDEMNTKNPKIVVNPDTGLVSTIFVNGVKVPVNQSFYYYHGFVGDNGDFQNRSSGAYIFRPDGPIVKIADKVSYQVYTGSIVSEVHQVFNEFVSQIVRVNTIDNFVEFDWIIGPLPQNQSRGIEVVTKYTSSLKSNSTFYTDSNGKGNITRVRDFRPTWKLKASEPISGNYYPITSGISIRDPDDDVDLVVLVDRAQGGSSLKDGEIEVMLHRVCMHDDAFGAGEALNETAFGQGLVVRGSHYVTAGKSIADLVRFTTQTRLLDTLTFITPMPNKDDEINHGFGFSGLREALFPNIQILTLEPWIGFSFLLRLEHVNEGNEDTILTFPVVLSMRKLFAPFEIVSAEETTLGANQWLKDNNRLRFGTNGTLEDLRYEDYNFVTDFNSSIPKLWREENTNNHRVKKNTIFNAYGDPLEIMLHPGHIRTFIVEIKRN